MRKLIRKVLREFVEETDSCRVEYDYFNVWGYVCYLNFVDWSDIDRIKNNSDNCKNIELHNKSGEKFIIPIDEIRFTNNDSKPYILANYFYNNIYPKLNINTKLIGAIVSSNIKKALKLSFKGTNNWSNETEDMSEGVINIEPTVGGNNWSVINYFDTKTKVHDILKSLISQDNNKNPQNITGSDNVKISGDEDIETYNEWVINWLSKVFKGEIHGDKLDKIKYLQKRSIEYGENTESKVIDYIMQNPEVIGLNGITKTVRYEPGHKKDRWGGIDVEFYGDSMGPIGVQIKPMSYYDKKNNSVNIGSSNTNNYKDKSGVEYLVFFNGNTKEIMSFNNSNYNISGSSYVFSDNPVYPNIVTSDI